MVSRRRGLIALVAGVAAFAGVNLATAAACTPITVPAVITTPGLYCLSADTVYSSVAPAIEVQANGVAIDFSGYRLHWNGAGAPQNPAVKLAVGGDNVLIRNGLISGFVIAVEALGSGAVIEDMRMNNNDMGIWVRSGGGGALIHRNFVRYGGGVNVDAGASHVRIVDNDFTGRSTTSNAVGSQGVTVMGMYAIASRNRFARLYTGLWFDNANLVYGKYQGNLTNNVTVPFTGGIDAGDNN